MNTATIGKVIGDLQMTPLKRGYDYRTFCPECNPRKVKE